MISAARRRTDEKKGNLEIKHTYDATGRLISVQNGNSLTAYTFFNPNEGQAVQGQQIEYKQATESKHGF